MGSCAAPSAKGDDKFITTDYLQQCHQRQYTNHHDPEVIMRCERIYRQFYLVSRFCILAVASLIAMIIW
ncbi:hypothetical protein [Proteus mirabilis]|uniref:hypothetical protein n=1 Tax=Proteus mirabilis TaxID=584 RepID=UPI0021AB94FF|nr:hypothetical protein [Proteus mirabilis]MCT8197093.1 hypothetical protein [Proteus mirabilis]MDF7347084.1 hypothetical protein [Proteus mirabilis]WOR90252.1 hypothetical protein R4T28_17265 [Proteus mirabilis]